MTRPEIIESVEQSPPRRNTPSPTIEPRAEATFGAGRGWLVLAWLAPLLCLAVNVYVLWGTEWPAFPYDEVTLLQMARMLAGEEVPDVVRGAGYYPGWAVLITPVWWFTSDPSSAYQASLWIGVAVSLVTIWPLALIARRLGLAAAPAVVVASFVMLLPARAVQADFSMSERLVTLFIACAVLAAFRVAERPSLLRHLVFASTLGLLLFSHVRMSVVLMAAGIWLLMRIPRHRLPSMAGLVLVAASYVAATKAGDALNAALIGRSLTREDALLQRISDSRPELFLRVGIGQSWYQSLASFGLIALGLVVVVLLVWRELRRWDFGAVTFLLGATAAVVFVSLAQWANDHLLYINPWVRLDAWVYGRYIDPIATVIVLVGVSALLVGVSRSVVLWTLGMNAVVWVLGFGYLTREVPTWGYVTPAHIPGILPWHDLLPTEPWPRDVGILPSLANENRIWIIAPLCVLVVLLVAVAARRRPIVVTGGLVVLAVVGTVISAAPAAQFHDDENHSPDMLEQLEPLTTLAPDNPIGYARGCRSSEGLEASGQNYLGYVVAPSPMPQVESVDDITDDMTIVLACENWRPATGLDARRLDTDSVYGSHVWIMPGALQDDLADEGRLVPAS